MVSTEKSAVLPGFFGEVRRRKVYRVAAAYIIAAGGVIQLASAAFPAWELPSWTLRVLIVCLLMGFPVALMLAWAFDITADGIQVTPDGATPRTHVRRNMILLVRSGYSFRLLRDSFCCHGSPRIKSTGRLQCCLSKI